MKKNSGKILAALKKLKFSKSIINSFTETDRSLFFDKNLNIDLDGNSKFPIGLGQHSEEPILLAHMLKLLELKKSHRVLEVGTGSGYSTAVLSNLVKEVVTVDFNETFAKNAKLKLQQLQIDNERFFAGDASIVSEELGEFDRIVIYAACQMTPVAILNNLKENALAVFPLGPVHQQQLCKFSYSIETGEQNTKYTLHDFCEFDPIRGEYGWKDQHNGYITDEANV